MQISEKKRRDPYNILAEEKQEVRWRDGPGKMTMPVHKLCADLKPWNGPQKAL